MVAGFPHEWRQILTEVGLDDDVIRTAAEYAAALETEKPAMPQETSDLLKALQQSVAAAQEQTGVGRDPEDVVVEQLHKLMGRTPTHSTEGDD